MSVTARLSKKIYGMQAAMVLNLMHKGKDLLALMK